jgi:hypothetical protein
MVWHLLEPHPTTYNTYKQRMPLSFLCYMKTLKAAYPYGQAAFEFGAGGRNRTSDLLITSHYK